MAEAERVGWANPSSVHRAGRAAAARVEEARRAVAAAIGGEAADVVFTSGGTEACNLAVLGLGGGLGPGDEILVTDLEHPAIERAVQHLAATTGASLVRVTAPSGVTCDAEAFATRLSARTRLAVVQWVNHETGTVWPVEGVARVASERGVPLVVDASQALGKLPVNVRTLGASALVLTSAKIGGPGGAGALWVERCRELSPTTHGGAQERGRRAGTPHVTALAGFGGAARALPERLAAMERVAALRDALEQACIRLGAVVNGAEGRRVATVSNVSFRGWRGDVLVAALDVEGLCASSGAACSSGLGAPSPVLRAMYPDEPWRAESALRLSLGPETEAHEVEQAIAILERVLARA